MFEKEAEDKGIKYADSLKMDIKVEDGVEGYAWYQVEQAYEKGALDFAEPREKRIAELEKENAELKSIADFQQSGNMSRYFELKRQAEKLEEAIDLLKQWLSLCGFKVEKLAKDTEQFLNSEGK